MYISRRRRNRTIGDFVNNIPYNISRFCKGKPLWQLFAIAASGVFVIGLVVLFLLFIWYGRDLPSPGKLSQVANNATVFYDRNGKVLFEMYQDKNRVPVAFADMSDYLKKATISIEDKNFYSHVGISNIGILRSILNMVLKRRIQGGGSTITQQLIKNVLLDNRQSASRKIKEAILAISVEGKYTKDQILEMYLNEVPYGGTYYGIGAASMGYFGKQPKDLTLLESAILAGFPQSPSLYSPFIGSKTAWMGRTKDVLRRMREDKVITVKQEEQATKDMKNIKFTSPKLSIYAPHFVFYIKEQIEKQFGTKILDQGMRVKTTIDLDTQQKVEEIVKKEVASLKNYKVGNGAAVVMDTKTNEILAMVGSYDYNNEEYGKFNAALGLRQPGSAIKPITFALAFEKGYTPATVLMDVKTTFPSGDGKDYIPENYDGKFRGPQQVRFVLANSLNIPSVKMLAMVGIRDFLKKANDMGLETLAPTDENLKRFGLAVTLGGGEVTLLDLTNAFSVFARGGSKKDIAGLLEIKDMNNKIIYKASAKQVEKRIFSQEVSFLISHILSDNNARTEIFGTNSNLNIPGKTVAVKTGTTNDKRDNWTVGYTNGVTVGVWVGNNDNSAMNQKIASGLTGASSIWHEIMVTLLKKYKDGIPEKTDKIRAVSIDAYLGGLPKDGYPSRSEYFIQDTEPKDISSWYKKLKISKSNGKIANSVEVKSGNYEEKDFVVITENDPVSTDGKNRWQEGIDAWLKEQNDSKYHYPTETSDNSSDSVIVSIKSPSDKENLTSRDLTVKARITSMASIKSIKIYLNGSEMKSINENKSEIEEKITAPSDGPYSLQVVAVNDKDKSGESTIKIGVNKAWDYVAPTSTPVPASSSSSSVSSSSSSSSSSSGQ